MNFKRLFLLPFLILIGLTNASFNAIEPVDSVVYKDKIYGPFYKTNSTENVTISMTYTYTGDHILEAKERFRIKYKTNFTSVYIVDYQTNPHSLVDKRQYTYSYTFCPTSVINERFGATFVFEVIDLNFDIRLDYEERDVFFTPESNNYNQSDIEELVKVRPTYYIFNLSKSDVPIEELDFTNTKFYAEESPNVYLDISNITIGFNAYKNLAYRSVYFRIHDPNRMFLYLDRDGDYASVSLTLSVINKKIYFYFDSLYVHPDTLEMANEPLAGFIKCGRIYFPLYRLSEVKPLNFEIYIKGFGYGNSSFTLECNYYPTGNLIGDCSNSEFCISGGVDYD